MSDQVTDKKTLKIMTGWPSSSLSNMSFKFGDGVICHGKNREGTGLPDPKTFKKSIFEMFSFFYLFLCFMA